MNFKGNFFNFLFNFWNDFGDKIKFIFCCLEFGFLLLEDEMIGKGNLCCNLIIYFWKIYKRWFNKVLILEKEKKESIEK